MPLTWFAHQVPAVGLKMARPKWVDATAMCIGSMMPDLMYSFSSYAHIDTHDWPAITYGVPLTIVVAILVRFVLAPVAPAQLPDLGDFRLHSYGVLAARRPPIMRTVVCALLGVSSHIFLDWFTHPGRPGTRWLGYDGVEVTMFGHTEPLAGAFQLLGHSFGSLAAVMLLLVIGRQRLLEQWYSREDVARARARHPSPTQRVLFWCVSSAGALGGLGWGWNGGRMELIERPFVGALGGATVAAAIVQLQSRGARRNGAPPLARVPARLD